MYLKNFITQYELVEFEVHSERLDEDIITVVDLLINCSLENFEENLGKVFVVETNGVNCVFSNFEVNECYKDDGFTRVICVR